jgi:hypothetical protein
MQVDGHGRVHPVPGGHGVRLDRLARLAVGLTLGGRLGGQRGPVAVGHPPGNLHALLMLGVVLEDQQPVPSRQGLGDQRQQGGAVDLGRVQVLEVGVQQRLGDRRVGGHHARGGLDEGRAVVVGRVERQRHHRGHQHRGREGEQHQQDAPGHAASP